MVVEFLVVVRAHVSSREERLNVLEELGINRHEVLEVSVLRTILDHPDLSVTFDDLSLDFADLLVDQRGHIAFSAENLLSGLNHAVRAKRVRDSRKPEGRFGFLP